MDPPTEQVADFQHLDGPGKPGRGLAAGPVEAETEVARHVQMGEEGGRLGYPSETSFLDAESPASREIFEPLAMESNPRMGCGVQAKQAFEEGALARASGAEENEHPLVPLEFEGEAESRPIQLEVDQGSWAVRGKTHDFGFLPSQLSAAHMLARARTKETPQSKRAPASSPD